MWKKQYEFHLFACVTFVENGLASTSYHSGQKFHFFLFLLFRPSLRVCVSSFINDNDNGLV